jgi:hypothetical protein
MSEQKASDVSMELAESARQQEWESVSFTAELLLMEGRLGWLADGAMNPIPPQYRDWVKNDFEHPARTTDERARTARPGEDERSAA